MGERLPKTMEDAMDETMLFTEERVLEQMIATAKQVHQQVLEQEIESFFVSGCMINELKVDYEEPLFEISDGMLIGHARWRMV